jgi:ABC-type multidrug transport system fused ATPase/permease subunit
MDSGVRLKDALELFELYKPEVDGEKNLETGKKPPAIEIKNITFTYPNGKSPVITNLNLTFKPGEKVAIVGENGAGKTTLVKLITRIYRPQVGEVSLNEININELKKTSLYKKFGVLFQDFNSYGNLSVTENIQIGKTSRKVDKELIEKALIKADAMNFVKEYPNFMDQILSERYKGGIRPSGGQWQKIAIARLFYRNAPILILDEPTASIDAVSEAKIFDNVYKFMKGKTVIIISHRFSTVRNADRILVLDKGKIIEEGTHEQLMKMDGKYAHAFRLQAKGYK